jgi:hypothetical protein
MREGALEVSGVFDIETANWTRFRVGQILHRTGKRFVTWDEDAFFERLASLRGVYYAHNGGSFDLLWFLDHASKRGMPWRATMRGSGVLAARIGDVELRDSIAIVPMSLEKAAPLGGAAKIGLGLPCECGADCGGYCALARPLYRAERSLVEEYLDADCRALLAVLDALERRAADCGIVLRTTIGSTAWATASAWDALPRCSHGLGRYRALREGYFGGRTEVFRSRCSTGHRYDIHSSYPAALARVELPVGEPERACAAVAARRFARGDEGIVTADVYVPPSMHVPPLPVRTRERLIYPVGPVSGTWTALELRRAVDAGARVDRVAGGYFFAASAPLLRGYSTRVWALRDAAARDGEKSWAAWFKWLANSLTGKLAQRSDKTGLVFVPAGDAAPEVDEGTRIVRCTRHGAFVASTTTRVDACAHVEWAAYLTADARTELGEQLRHADDPVYCDTDSVYAPHVLTRRVGDALGEWGHEGAMRDFMALAPKVYAYTDADGRRVVRGKGMSGLTPDGFDALAQGDVWIVDRGVQGLRSSVRSSDALFTRRLMRRGLHPTPGWIGGRVLHDDGSTSPPTVERYRTRLDT